MIEFHRIRAYMLRHLYEIRASLDRKADIFFFPVIDILTFGFLTVYINKLNVQAGVAGAILGAIILWTMIYNIQRDMSFSVLDDAWSRNLYNLYSTPLRLAEIILGSLFISVIKACVIIAIILAIAWGVFHFSIFQVGTVIFFYIFNIFLFSWAFGYFTASLIFRFGTKAQAVAWSLILIIYPISGVFYPLSTLPPFLARIAEFLPISHIFEGLRAIIVFGRPSSPADLVTIFLLNVVYLCVGLWLFVRGFRNAKARGWFIHPT
jgi:ABC-2 type transport system permease protein